MSVSGVDEREELRRTVRAFLADHADEPAVRRAMESAVGYDPETWRRFACELGVAGLAVPEEYGGAGGVAELGVVCAEVGRVLMCGPFLSNALAAQALVASGDADARAAYLPGIAAGETVATVAVAERDGRWRTSAYSATARRRDGGWRLSGTKWFVTDGMAADLVLVAASTEDGPRLFAVATDAPGLTRSPLVTLDLTRRQARLDLDAVPARPIGPTDGGDGTALISHVLDAAAALTAIEQASGARWLLEMTTAYARERVQFGRPIGSFQAVKHKLADVLVSVESAHSAAYRALDAWATGDAEFPLIAALAKAYCSEAYLHAAHEAVQLHGGIGFTWEHPAHLYLKRARSTHELFDPPALHRTRMAELLST
ncbi:acyl-CoA dehydrogenase family protein [Yinghuangia sp. YIM S09857]|uniref:acyl-CoA dehydrogenase family protein n=1 Tax=Yinghuangia sp. YIM S09857 TaxID=3436929 RepID=UPI003F52941D